MIFNLPKNKILNSKLKVKRLLLKFRKTKIVMTISESKKNIPLQIFTITLRYLIGSAFVFSSIVKIKSERFTTESGASAPINDAWHFFETLFASGLYWNFLGWMQILAGFLLMTQRLSTIGALLFLPIISNIFFITISYDFAGTPIITFLMLMANIYLIFWDWNKLKVLLLNGDFIYVDDNPEFSKRTVWSLLGILYFFLVIVMQISAKAFTKDYSYKLSPMFFLTTCLLLAVILWGVVIKIQLQNNKS